MAAVPVCSDFGAQEEKICHYFHLFPFYLHAVMGPDAIILAFKIFSLKPALSLFLFILFKRLFNSSSLSAIRKVSSAYWVSLVAQIVKNLPAMWRPGFNSWIGKISWRSEWLPTPVFLPGEFHGQGAWRTTVHRVTKS